MNVTMYSRNDNVFGRYFSNLCQFQQHFTRTIFTDILLPKSLKAERFSFVIFGAKYWQNMCA